MEFEWDESKRSSNLVKHGIDFERAKEIWGGPVLEVPSVQPQHNESRYLGIGVSEGRVITVVFVDRAGRRRIISARKARRDEKEAYEAALGQREGGSDELEAR